MSATSEATVAYTPLCDPSTESLKFRFVSDVAAEHVHRVDRRADRPHATGLPELRRARKAMRRTGA